VDTIVSPANCCTLTLYAAGLEYVKSASYPALQYLCLASMRPLAGQVAAWFGNSVASRMRLYGMSKPKTFETLLTQLADATLAHLPVLESIPLWEKY
jgi:hypothetical protein